MAVSEKEVIKKLRMQAGMTQKEFAELIGCSTKTIANWEQGERSPASWVVALIEEKVRRM